MFLDKFNEPFYFGIGGIGDCLLLLSSFYESIPIDEKVNLIFWANDKHAIEAFLLAFDLDRKLNYKIVFQGWQPKSQFEQIVSHPLFRGKAHIPDNLEYVKEWSQNWQKYRALIPEKFEFLKRHTFNIQPNFKMIGVCGWGSRADDWKRKELKKDEFNGLVKAILNQNENNQVVIFGSQKDLDDKEDKQLLEWSKKLEPWKIIDLRGRSFNDMFGYLGLLSLVYSTDTWFKYWTLWCGIPTALITRFSENPSGNRGKNFIPLTVDDPADNIFIKDWPWLNYKFILDDQNETIKIIWDNKETYLPRP